MERNNKFSRQDVAIGVAFLSTGFIGSFLILIFLNEPYDYLFLIILYPFFSLIFISFLFLLSGFNQLKISRKKVVILLIIGISGVLLIIGIDQLFKLISGVL